MTEMTLERATEVLNNSIQDGVLSSEEIESLEFVLDTLQDLLDLTSRHPDIYKVKEPEKAPKSMTDTIERILNSVKSPKLCRDCRYYTPVSQKCSRFHTAISPNVSACEDFKQARIIDRWGL